MEFVSNYNNYKSILGTILASGKLCDYREAADRAEFILLRHDVEFSVERAYAMSLIESEMGVCSTYFIQIANNAYNAFSQKNRELIADMREHGHHIGLHYHRCGKTDHEEILADVKLQLRVMSEMVGFAVDRFAMHRPAQETRYYDLPVEGVINAYSPEFFTFVEELDENTALDVKYIADSQCRWNYGCPDADTLAGYPKIQLLLHPDYWSETGSDACDNFAELIKENRSTFTETLDNECRHFHMYKDELKL